MHIALEKLVEKYPDLAECVPDLERTYETLMECYQHGGKVLVCGNGGSAADSDHIVGELMKGFVLPRRVPAETRQNLLDAFPEDGAYLADHLQGALPTISLVSHTALMTAFSNDVAPDLVFAQQVYGYGQSGDTLIGISTSGNSKNVMYAMQVARVRGLHTIGFTGRYGGKLKALCDITVRVPRDSTLDIQERQLPIYHTLCGMLEEAFFA
jgi:phosphoheptose isomerase